MRWRHPTRGLLMPRDFIHLAELTGAIGPLDRWVLEEAGRQAAAWGADGPTGSGRILSVNLSPLALVQPGLVTLVRDVLVSSGLKPEQLLLEVTETLQPDPRGVATTLSALKALGVRLAIDDFGTGFASVSRLLDSPFDVIKIDEGLLQSMKADPRAERHRQRRDRPRAAAGLHDDRRGGRERRAPHRAPAAGLRARPGLPLRSGPAAQRSSWSSSSPRATRRRGTARPLGAPSPARPHAATPRAATPRAAAARRARGHRPRGTECRFRRA